MGVKDHRKHGAKAVVAAVLTVSDTRNRRTDETGRILRQALEKAGHRVIRQGIVKDERREIRSWVRDALRDVRIHAVVVNGGTGISRRDVTIETVRPLLDKELEGFGELFRMLSHREIGSAAMMSRALAGVSGRRLVICLPGSPDAARLALSELLLPELGHMVWEAKR
ncbi:MAG: MogA/MoaB family molybdenum cofactor biosynthesis protein [Euryarchaeota archaeon]|nr:MogA/MoaB family molybdenum cofactor biosynthesis protein [Euryarchaeota archaeon]